VPFNTTILVCPGSYPEQVVISQPLTLEGVTDGIGDAAVITVPGGGLVQNVTTTLWGPISAQLAVANTVGVKIQNIAVDGTGGSCAAGANREVGLVFTNVGTSNDGTTAGTAQNVVVRNIAACAEGEGIGSDNSYVTIESSSVQNVDLSCINIGGGLTNTTSNNVQGCVNGIVLNYTPSATIVTKNSFSNLVTNGNSIYVNAGAAGQVTNNNIGASPGSLFYGILLYNSTTGTKVTGNTITNNGYGIVLNYAYQTTVQSNIVVNSGLGLTDTTSFGGNVVTKNTVNEAQFGIFTDSSVGGDTLIPNNMYNVVVTIDPAAPPSKTLSN
jgi:parallel beta-helix repeat protein